MRDAHFSICALFISGAGHIGACCKPTVEQGDESCHDDRVHGDRDGMQTARAARSRERRKNGTPAEFFNVTTQALCFPKRSLPVGARAVYNIAASV